MNSKEISYRRYDKIGKRRTDGQLILIVIKTEPDIHAMSISNRTGIKQSTVTARVDELRCKGLIYVSGSVLYKGYKQSTYRHIRDKEAQKLQAMRISEMKYFCRLRTMLSIDSDKMHKDTCITLKIEKEASRKRLLDLSDTFNKLINV